MGKTNGDDTKGKPLKVSWDEIQERINHLQIRERRLLCITVVVVILFLLALITWDPLYQAWVKDYQANATTQRQISGAQTTIDTLKGRANLDVNAQSKQQINSLKKRLADQQQQIQGLTSALITPKNMGQVFTGLLRENALIINKISNLDAVAVKIEGQLEETNLLYQHGLSLELSGQFMKALRYIQSVEEQDWQLYWDELKFTTEHYPQGTLKVEVHTLSTSDSLLDL